jgi:hypothetical protein
VYVPHASFLSRDWLKLFPSNPYGIEELSYAIDNLKHSVEDCFVIVEEVCEGELEKKYQEQGNFLALVYPVLWVRILIRKKLFY